MKVSIVVNLSLSHHCILDWEADDLFFTWQVPGSREAISEKLQPTRLNHIYGKDQVILDTEPDTVLEWHFGGLGSGCACFAYVKNTKEANCVKLLNGHRFFPSCPLNVIWSLFPSRGRIYFPTRDCLRIPSDQWPWTLCSLCCSEPALPCFIIPWRSIKFYGEGEAQPSTNL